MPYLVPLHTSLRFWNERGTEFDKKYWQERNKSIVSLTGHYPSQKEWNIWKSMLHFLLCDKDKELISSLGKWYDFQRVSLPPICYTIKSKRCGFITTMNIKYTQSPNKNLLSSPKRPQTQLEALSQLQYTTIDLELAYQTDPNPNSDPLLKIKYRMTLLNPGQILKQTSKNTFTRRQWNCNQASNPQTKPHYFKWWIS